MRKADPPRILLSGRPGSGKTTAVIRTVELLGSGRCQGFYTEEVRQGGRRIGFDVVTLDGGRGPLARAGGAGPRVGRYGVDLRSFEELALESLEAALGSPNDRVLVLDEIGRMELRSDRFRRLLGRVFDLERPRPVLATVMARPRSEPEVERYRRRPDIQLIEVQPDNRADLPRLLCDGFLTYLGDTA